MDWNARFPADLRSHARTKDLTAFCLATEGKAAGRMEMTGTMSHETASRVWRFTHLVRIGKDPREAFEEAWAASKAKAREHPRGNSEAGSLLPVDRKPLFMVRDEPGGGKWRLSTEQSYPESRLADDYEVTLEAMATMLDQDAKATNIYDFAFCHAALAMLLHRVAGREVATQVMRYLVDLDGLHGDGSVCRRKNVKAVAAILGVPLDDSGNWRLGP